MDQIYLLFCVNEEDHEQSKAPYIGFVKTSCFDKFGAREAEGDENMTFLSLFKNLFFRFFVFYV